MASVMSFMRDRSVSAMRYGGCHPAGVSGADLKCARDLWRLPRSC